MKKKLVSLMLVAAMTASLTACGSKKTEEPTSTVHKSITAAEYDAAITSDAAIYKKAFTMPEYKGIQVTVDKSVLNVAESDVDDYINKNIVSAEATTENVTSGVTADGDTVILDYSGKLDGEAFSGGTATDTTYTIGSGNFISDLDKGLVGLTVGQEYDIPCTFPDNYTSDLAGKSVIFTVKVTAIQKTTYPEITDEWVVNNKESLNLSGDTVADFREEVRKIVEANANDTYLNNTFTSAYQIISENIGDVNYPQDEIDSLVEVLNTNIESEFNTYGSYYGISDLDTYKKSVYGFDSIDAFNEYATSSAQQYLLQKMIVTIIAADNDIHVSEDEINSYGNDLAQYYGYDDFNAIVDAVGSEVVSEIGYEILYQKVVEFECSQITEVEQYSPRQKLQMDFTMILRMYLEKTQALQTEKKTELDIIRLDILRF